MLPLSDNRKFASLTLRPVHAADAAFLRHLYFQVHRGDFNLTDSAQLDSILNLQFSARRQHYLLQFPNARHFIVVFNTDAVGQLRMERTAQELRLIDISILPAHQNRGIGTELLGRLQKEATEAHLPLRLSVLHSNLRALRLYESLGFGVIDSAAPYISLEWRPAAYGPAIYGADPTPSAGD